MRYAICDEAVAAAGEAEYTNEIEKLDYIDLCIVLGNLLDNAIEAGEKLTSENKYIHITLRQNKGVLVIRISNPIENTPVPNRINQTTKDDPEFHGIGLQSVEEIVNKCHGTLQIKNEGGIFLVEALLYLKSL